MARLLVTGAGGFVGSHLIELLEPDHPNVTGWLRPGAEPLVRGSRITWQDVEMHDREDVARAIANSAPDHIYHLAGVPHVGFVLGAFASFAAVIVLLHNVALFAAALVGGLLAQNETL